MPPGVDWTYVEAPFDLAHRFPRLPASRHRYGVVQTETEIDPRYVEHFDLTPIPEEPT